MAAIILTSALLGLDGHVVHVECDISPGLPAFLIVGLADAAVQEARERVRSALKHTETPFPRTKITINLGPAHVRKVGTHFDLPIAVAILTAHGELPKSDMSTTLLVGELSLDGRLRPVPGILSTALLARRLNVKELIVPFDNRDEAALIPRLSVFAAHTLAEVVQHLNGTQRLPILPHTQPRQTFPFQGADFSCIRGQEQSKRALEIAAAGGHNILLQGPPGSGKTFLARALPGILPPITYEEALDVTRIHSVVGILPSDGFVSERPFRSPHHTASGVSLVGGGTIPKPGEISLAHRGVLFLDELPEFSRTVLENLRQPLEDGCVSVSRAQGSMIFPARFLLVAAMNPCPCGFATDPDRACICTPFQLASYRKRLSGPLLDRLDLIIHVPKVPTEHLISLEQGELSACIRTRVEDARERQRLRYEQHHLLTNAELRSDQIRDLLTISDNARALLVQAMNRYKFSARIYFRLLKISQTIADLAASPSIESPHIAEALQYRQLPE